VFHRDFNQSRVEACPDASLVGRSFADIAASRGADVVDTFLDLCAEHGDALRWVTMIGNDRPKVLRKILAHPDIVVGFSDAGAHLRNMAFYDIHLRMLALARDAQRDGVPFMSMERAVWRCTGELAEWWGLDAGVLAEGKRADAVVLDPEKLSAGTLEMAPVAELGGYQRLVRRSPAVEAVIVGGRVAWGARGAAAGLGREPFGRFLGYGERSPARKNATGSSFTRAASSI
jgi:N-acyl-D-aspartate/D-glutamate deacylase